MFPQVMFNDNIYSMEDKLEKKFKKLSEFTNYKDETFLFALYEDCNGDETVVTIAHKGPKGWIGSDQLTKIYDEFLWLPSEMFLQRVKVFGTMIVRYTETMPDFAVMDI